MNVNYNKKTNKFITFVCFVIFLTNVGQTPIFIDNFQTRNIIIPIWLLLALVSLRKNHILYLGDTKHIWLLSTIWFLIFLIGGLFISGYKKSDLPYTIFLSLFILFIGLIIGKKISSDDLDKICTAFILSGIIVCIDTFFTYVYGVSLAGRVYSYDSKNSVSQILLTVWILVLFFKLAKKIVIWKKMFYIIAFFLLTITLIGLKSRATLIAIPTIIIWVVIHGDLNKRLKNLILISLIFLIIFFVFKPEYIDSLINNVFLAGRSINNLNDLSSGRAIEWQMFFTDFSDRPLFGHGRMKRESLILTSLLEFGFIGGGLILLIACWPLYWGIHYLNKTNIFYLTFTSIAIVYTINGVFEQLAPFGPGVKCYFLWFLFGVLVSKQQSKDFNCCIERV